MLYTVTFNPALDYVVDTDALSLGGMNRTHGERIFCGGKGINVSLILSQLGIRSTALGFVAGFTGDELERRLINCGVATDFIRLRKGFTRINIKIRSGIETEVNGSGPSVDSESMLRLFERLDRLTEGDMLVLAGSVPEGIAKDVYGQMLARLSDRNVLCAVDATGKLLTNALVFHPFLIKPNSIELGDIFGITLTNVAEIEKYARLLQKDGARNVLVSMAGDGALLIDEQGVSHKIGALQGTVKNSVGAGDSMMAGFLAGYIKTGDYDYALRLGTAAGGATAFSDDLANSEQIYELFNRL